MGREPRRYVGTATVGEWIGVSPQTVTIYLRRYEGTKTPCPTPDVIVGDERGVPGWLPERKKDWLEWAANRPGPGVGGGPRVRYMEAGRVRLRVGDDGTVIIDDRTLTVGREHAGRTATIVEERHQDTGALRWRVLVGGEEVKLIRPKKPAEPSSAGE